MESRQSPGPGSGRPFRPTPGQRHVGDAPRLLTANGSTVVAFASEAEQHDELAPDELAACLTLPEHRRREWRAGRLAVKRAVAAALNVQPSNLTTCEEAGGSPAVRVRALQGESDGPLPRVSLAHRDGLAVGVADPCHRVGVDIERAGAIWTSARRYFLTAAEKASPLDATTLWSLKEAAWKALECGTSTLFSALELGLVRGVTVNRVTLEGRSHPAGAEVWSPRPGYLVAVIWIEESAQ